MEHLATASALFRIDHSGPAGQLPFYLHDQAEVLQSGYLLNLKAEPQMLSVTDLGSDRAVELGLIHAAQGPGSICYLLHSMELERI